MKRQQTIGNNNSIRDFISGLSCFQSSEKLGIKKVTKDTAFIALSAKMD
jgi:hypothetical protein